MALQASQDLLNSGGQIARRDELLSAGRDFTSTTRNASPATTCCYRPAATSASPAPP
ncbi:hypothetical protein NG824_20575 [Xanthomonas sacchari]|uniref:Uncharacterized protein n=1 Tax=Xanthomonas sacchari TaxID=56458 RepID=A0AA46SUK4_9XANT|nr:hypothetical protein [Xanthomonas sacchari]UYK88825.1 hypothetical protein NG824_20575 [Xanthomonas sacchari]